MVLKKIFNGFSLDENLVTKNGKLIRKGIMNNSYEAISSLLIPPLISFNLNAASIEKPN